MKIKHNYLFIPTLIILIAAFYWVTNNDERVERSKLLSDRALINFEVLDIIEVITPDVEIRLEKVGGSGESGTGTADDWRMVSPFETGCNPESLAALINAIQTAESERDIPDITSDQLTEYGLDNPELRVKVASGGSGEVMMNLLVGEKNPAGTSQYAMFENSASVFLVPIYSIEGMQIDINSIRDRRVMRFNRDAVSSIQLSSAQDEITFENIDSSWKVTSPRIFVASPARIDVLFHDLEELRADEFLADASDPHFSTRNVDVMLTAPNGETHELHIFGEDVSRGIFATSSWQPSPFIVESYILDRLAVPQDVFVYNVLIDIPIMNITKILLRQPGDENIEMVKSDEYETGWDLVKPVYADTPNSAAYNTFIETMYALKPSLAAPDELEAVDMGLYPTFFLKLEVESETEAAQSVKLGNVDEYGNYYATMDDVSFVVVPKELVDVFIEAADNIRLSD